jgi:hypothetical protein
VTLLRECNPEIYPAGKIFQVKELGKIHYPELPEEGIPILAWEMVKKFSQAQDLDKMPAEVIRLKKERQKARLLEDWAAADLLRKRIADLGWMIQDTPEGQKIFRQS